VCPFCQGSIADYLERQEIDLGGLAQFLVARGTSREEMRNAAASVRSVPVQLRKAADWTKVIGKRDDVYDSLEGSIASCMCASGAETACAELRQEREILREMADELDKIALEAESDESPLLSAILSQV
jgi:hypothetical protein